VKHFARRLATVTAAGGLLYAAGSWLAARSLARRLISPEGFAPSPGRHEDLLVALESAATVVANLRHRGSPRLPVELSAIFASPGEPEGRPTILFLHGKGGDASEWEPDALRALQLGYNVLLPDLRGHGRSGGSFFTFGFLEKDDLALTIAAARDGFGIDAERIGIHSCSAGSSVALAFAAEHAGVRGIWLESPFGQPREMARHYLSRTMRLPGPLLALTSRLAITRAGRAGARRARLGGRVRRPRGGRPGARRRARHRSHPARSRRRRPPRARPVHARARPGPSAAQRRLERLRRRTLPSRG